jgi:hypothetical protein
MVLIFSKENSPRLEYTVRLIFHDILGTGATITNNRDYFHSSEAPKLNYSEAKMDHELFLKASSFLFSSEIQLPDIQPVIYGEETGFFETSSDSFLPFDPLASTFLMVSRMEEYLPGERDQHGRFPATASLLYKHDLLEKPVVNRWARMIADRIEVRYGESLFPAGSFTFLSTIDVDNAWAYQHKGLLRTAAASFRDLAKGDLKEFSRRFRVLIKSEKDPYDTFPYLKDYFKGNKEKVIFFFLLGDYARYDRQVSWKNSHFRTLIREISHHFKVGIHPSMASSFPGHFRQIEAEKERLETILSEKVYHSRQHFLRLNFPETYQQLIQAGIREDYSMGYPEKPGFRAGTCTPFLFYDLTREETTGLKIYPFQIMEMTFLQYLGLSPADTISRINKIMNEVNAAGGTFCTIWHNESLTGEGKWKGFREVFEEMHQTGFRYANKA